MVKFYIFTSGILKKGPFGINLFLAEAEKKLLKCPKQLFDQLMFVYPRKKQNKRSEASVQVSEFFVNAEGKCKIYLHYIFN